MPRPRKGGGAAAAAAAARRRRGGGGGGGGGGGEEIVFGEGIEVRWQGQRERWPPPPPERDGAATPTTVAVTSSLSSASSAAEAEAEEAAAADGGSTSLLVLFSVPLAMEDTDRTIVPLEPIDLDAEVALLKRSLRESGRRVCASYEVATVDNFRSLLTLGRFNAVHFSGHGHPHSLAFEDGCGAAHFVDLGAAAAHECG